MRVLALAMLLLCVPSWLVAPSVSVERPPDKPWRPPARERGVASWYGRWHHGKRMSNGQPFDMYAMTAASRTLPLGTVCEVVAGARSVVVIITDRGPYIQGRIIDLSYAAMAALGGVEDGLKEVTVYACK